VSGASRVEPSRGNTKLLPFSKSEIGPQGVFALPVSDFTRIGKIILAITSHGVVRPINLTRLTGLTKYVIHKIGNP
jgi:hypothetical protein